MVRNRANRLMSLVAVAAVATVVGCQTVAPNQNAEGTVSPNLSSNPTVVTPGSNATTTTPGEVGTQASPVTNPDLLLSAKPMSLKGEEGGVYVSADGQLQAQFPPGALDGDAEIRLARVDTAGTAITPRTVPGIRFQVDLGGASLKPGAKATVTAKVDDRFVDTIKAEDPNFTPEKYNLVSDGKGGYGLRMAINGPAVRSVEPVDEPATNFMEEGGFTNFPTQLMGGGLAALGGRQAIETYCVYRRCWDGTTRAIDHSGPCPEPPPPVPVIANMTWASDDVSLSGKPAEGAIAYFSVYDAKAQVGPTGEVVAGGNGVSQTSVRQGFGVGVQTYFRLPVPVSGNSGSGNAAFTLTSRIPLNSPEITLNFDTAGDVKIDDNVTIKYTINGGAPITVTNNTKPTGSTASAAYTRLSDNRARLVFRAPVPGNRSDYKFSLVGVESANTSVHPSALENIKNMNVWRNTSFAYNVQMIGNAAK